MFSTVKTSFSSSLAATGGFATAASSPSAAGASPSGMGSSGLGMAARAVNSLCLLCHSLKTFCHSASLFRNHSEGVRSSMRQTTLFLRIHCLRCSWQACSFPQVKRTSSKPSSALLGRQYLEKLLLRTQEVRSVVDFFLKLNAFSSSVRVTCGFGSSGSSISSSFFSSSFFSSSSTLTSSFTFSSSFISASGAFGSASASPAGAPSAAAAWACACAFSSSSALFFASSSAFFLASSSSFWRRFACFSCSWIALRFSHSCSACSCFSASIAFCISALKSAGGVPITTSATVL
mmetsp:Transcript_56387/g.101339  ORF Transcript_56387/g.101339 Transcript_56387/m.101339 type:complete len:291 (-) Transcript_56387:674-1546(-)